MMVLEVTSILLNADYEHSELMKSACQCKSFVIVTLRIQSDNDNCPLFFPFSEKLMVLSC